MDKEPVSIRSTCLYCAHRLHGRADKRFCNAACRNAYHNKMRIQGLKGIKAVNRVLLKNYLILLDYWNSGLTEVPRTVLEKKGFNWNYFTSIRTMSNGLGYFFVYDMGYCVLNGGNVRLIKREKPSGIIQSA
jgi:hypothetical protein